MSVEPLSAASRSLRLLRGLTLMLLLLLPLGVYAIDALPFADRAEEARFQNLAKQLRCLVCQNESLADSHAELAKDLRDEVFEQMRLGKSDDQIKTYLTDRYSDFVLYDPPLRAGTVLLWFGPLLLLLIGAGIVTMIVRKRSIELQPAETAAREEDW
ncbi:MAG: cytochrome c-type biogenesis protein [Dokdonella sp.]